MHRFFKLSCCFLLSLLLLSGANHCYAQHKKTKSHRSVKDSLRKSVLKRDSLLRTFKHSDNSLNALLQKVEYFNSSYTQDRSDFAQGFDTLEIEQKLPSMERRMPVMSTLIDNDRSSSLGYLFTIRDLLSHFKDDLDNWQGDLSDDAGKLDKIHDDITEFKQDTAMHTMPDDSVLRVKYLSEVTTIQQKWLKLDTAIQKSLIKIGLLQNRVTSLNLLLIDVNDRIDLKIHDFSVRSLSNEYGYIWETDNPAVTKFDTVINKTTRLNLKMLKYFFNPSTTSHVNIISHTVVVVLFLGLLTWIYSSRRKLKRLRDDYQNTFNQTHYIVKNAFVSALAVAVTLALYLYDQPPFAFLEIIFLLMMICIGILVKPVWPKPMFKFWLQLMILMPLYAFSNLFIQVCNADRIFLLILSAASIVAGNRFLKESKANTSHYPPHSRLVVKLYVFLNAFVLLLDVMGRFSLAKIIGVAALFNLSLALGFYLVLQVLMETLFLQLEANKSKHSSLSSYIDFKIVQGKFKSVLVKIAIVLWFMELLENLDIDDYLYDQASDFLTHQYKVGTSVLTFGSLVIFVVVIWISILVSRVISYFYDYADQQLSQTGDVRKSKTSVLLIRLFVFSIGFIAAIIFSGIPLTEVTIVLGALGVGIGFGLQNIVNNLVSGVILAFEKPVQVGDVIEVGNRSGTIKDIGIRASKIEAGDGSELIVPNGDLISQHVINWTLTNNNRRVELIVGVGYGSDIQKVEDILKNIVRNREDIMQSPAPLVFMHNFSETSIDFRILFWAADIGKWVSLRSSVMAEIYTEFAKQGIEIPHSK